MKLRLVQRLREKKCVELCEINYDQKIVSQSIRTIYACIIWPMIR